MRGGGGITDFRSRGGKRRLSTSPCSPQASWPRQRMRKFRHSRWASRCGASAGSSRPSKKPPGFCARRVL